MIFIFYFISNKVTHDTMTHLKSSSFNEQKLSLSHTHTQTNLIHYIQSKNIILSLKFNPDELTNLSPTP